MLFLDNFLNVAAAPNENYARELMELHTLGVDGGYTEDDVKEVARCFTGCCGAISRAWKGRSVFPGRRISTCSRNLSSPNSYP